MKKIFLLLTIFFVVNTAGAENLPDLKYKNINIKDKIKYNIETDVWSDKVSRKDKNYFVKTKGFGSFYDYVDSNRDFAFSTDCEYEFIYNDSLIGYSNRDMKFYEIMYGKNTVGKRALTKEEVQAILPDYKILSLSDFSSKTNSLKIKKGFGNLKVMLYNDTDDTFDNFVFTSGNSKFEQYDLRGFLTVQTSGMIQFSRLGEQYNNDWYILLVR